MNQSLNTQHILLVGPGAMGLDYFKVLKSLQVGKVSVVGRGDTSSSVFAKTTGVAPEVGLSAFLSKNPADQINAAIVAVNVEELAGCVKTLIEHGIKSILLEKPGGTDLNEIGEVAAFAEKYGATINIAYNRRFYSSVRTLRKLCEKEGGIQSLHFDFTEWEHVILPKISDKKVLDNWIYANSSHMIDLAFHLAGDPKSWNSYASHSLDWHPKAAVFAGAGITQKNVLFSYSSNWIAPGRWGMEICTKESKYFLRPVEKLHVQKHRSVAVNLVDVDDTIDIEFKPGLYLQVQAVLENGGHPNMLKIDQHYRQARDVLARIVEPNH